MRVCPAGYFCIFADPNGYGTIAYFKFGSPDLRQQHIDNAASFGLGPVERGLLVL